MEILRALKIKVIIKHPVSLSNHWFAGCFYVIGKNPPCKQQALLQVHRRLHVLPSLAKRRNLQKTFGADLPVYSFQNFCAEKSGLALNDGAKKFFFNAASAENEKDLAIKAFLNYIKSKEPQDPLTEQIEECVERIRLAEASKGAYMFESLRIRDSIMAGKKMGREEMGVESAKNLYANGVSVEIIAKSLGMTEEQVKEIVSAEATA